MKKYLILIYITASVMSFAQFKDNVFEQQDRVSQNQELTATPQQSTGEPNAYNPDGEPNSSSLIPNGGEQPEGPGNPGEPVPINDYIPLLLLGSFSLMIYYHRKNNKINI